MADDTREPTPASSSLSSNSEANSAVLRPQSQPEKPKNYVDFGASANAFADTGMSQNTAGAHVQPKATFWDAATTIHPSEYSSQFFGKTCVRQGLLVGIAGGFVAGSLAVIARKPVPMSGNIAVGTSMFLAFTSHEICQARLRIEKDNMARVKDVMDRKAAQKQAKLEELRRRRDEHKAAEAAKATESKPWWKVW